MTELDRFVGIDLWKQIPTKEDAALLASLLWATPEKPCGDSDYYPSRIWRREVNRKPAYLVFLAYEIGLIPSGTSACVRLLDANLKNIRTWVFQTGWRNVLGSATLQHSAELDADLITVQTAPMINGRPIAREHFAIVNDQLWLVRLEGDRGEIVQNEYCFKGYSIGPSPSAKTVRDWLKILSSSEKTAVLSALVFLGARHIVEPARRGLEDDSYYAALFLRIMASPHIRDRIEELRKSDHKWIRQAAELAAREPGERPLP